MLPKSIIELQNQLTTFSNKPASIVQGGFLQSQFSISQLHYFVEYEILSVMDEKSENFIKINLNQIYQIETLPEKIILSLDNDTTITITSKLVL